MHHAAYRAVKESFGSQWHFYDFVGVHQQIENFKPEWRRELLYHKPSERSLHN